MLFITSAWTLSQIMRLSSIGMDPHILSADTPEEIDAAAEPLLLKKTVEEAEKTAIRRALRLAEGNRSKAALFLGIGRRTLYDKLACYRIDTGSPD